jgi:hypothetical protein
VESLFQLDLDEGDETLLLREGKLAFCLATMLKCLSRDAIAGESPSLTNGWCELRHTVLRTPARAAHSCTTHQSLAPVRTDW